MIATSLVCGDVVLSLDEPRVMGIVNVTPDSFSDGGRALDPSAAIARAEALIVDGAEIVDVGAESTRPGAPPLRWEDEWTRLAPVLAGLRDARVTVSVDTRHAETMRRALDAGASMINDVSGFRDPAARAIVGRARCGVCVMHMQGKPETMQVAPDYADVVVDVMDALSASVASLVDAGVDEARIVIDPGFGFGKTLAHNLALMRGLDRFAALGRPIAVGLSRKGTIGAITGKPVDERLAGSLAAALIAVEAGARIVRAHDVAETADALRMWSAVRSEGREDARPR